MINLITAVGNPYINEQIKNMENYNVILKDIQYFEGILEILKIHKNIDILLISTTILLEKNFIEIIREDFENLEIVIFIDKNIESDIAYFNSKRIYKIYSNDKNGYDNFLKSLNYSSKNVTEKVKNDMSDLKREILQKQNKKIEKRNFLVHKKNKDVNKIDSPKVIMISGTRGVRKKHFFNYIF